jgi:hypothetical protein
MIVLGQTPGECQKTMTMPAWMTAPGLNLETAYPEKLVSDIKATGWRALLSHPDLQFNARNTSVLLAGAGNYTYLAVPNFDVLVPAIKFAFTADTENNLIKMRIEIDIERYTSVTPLPPVTVIDTSYWDGQMIKNSGSTSARFVYFNAWAERSQYNESTAVITPLRDLPAKALILRDEGSPDVQIGDVKSLAIRVITTNPTLQTSINLVTPGSEDFEDYCSNYMAGNTAQVLNNLIQANPEIVAMLNVPVSTTSDGKQVVDTKRLLRRS